MKLITHRDLIRGVAQNWKRQYFNDKQWMTLTIGGKPGISSETIYDALSVLDTETATPDDVACIIGNSSWAQMKCGECQRDVTAFAQLGEEPDYDSATVNVCSDCLKRALELF